MPYCKEQQITAKRIFKTMLVVALIVLGFSYLHFQARDLMMGPRITLLENFDSVQNERTLMLEGEAHNITFLSLNGKQIYTDGEGMFRKKLVLEDGYTIMTLYARDRFGRSTSISRPFVYVPASTIN